MLLKPASYPDSGPFSSAPGAGQLATPAPLLLWLTSVVQQQPFKGDLVMQGQELLAGWRSHAWIALLLAISVVLSLRFACATPLAAFSSIAAVTLSQRNALGTTA